MNEPPQPARWSWWRVVDLVVVAVALERVARVLDCWRIRRTYPFDLEWMEGGMLVHAWRLREGLPIYTEPSADWIPFLYPPGYPALVAALSGVTGEVTTGLARAVSAGGSLSAALALLYAGIRFGGSAVGGLLGAGVFLLTYPDSGAFFDLIRPDGLGVGLLAWALVLGLHEDRRTTVASGLLLALAFTVKHNLAAFGLPMLLGITADRGWREGLRFALASVVPALLFLVGMQASTGGHFLTWLLDVAGAHPLVMARWYPGTMAELGADLPWVVLGVWTAAFAATVGAIRERSHRRSVVLAALLGAVLSVGIGESIPALFELLGADPRHLRRITGATSFGARVLYLVQGAAVGTVLAASVAWVRERHVPRAWVYGMGTAAMAFFLGGLMRAHHGGFLNVYIPVHLVVGLGAAVGFGRVRARWPGPVPGVLALLPFAVFFQAAGAFDPEPLQPTAEDAAAGWAFVEVLEQCEPPVLAPIDPWLAQLAGHRPSWHLMALWDIDHPRGPYQAAVPDIRAAVAEARWNCVVFSNRPLRYDFEHYYRQFAVPSVEGKSPGRRGPGTLSPRTGWRDRPASVWVPRR